MMKEKNPWTSVNSPKWNAKNPAMGTLPVGWATPAVAPRAVRILIVEVNHTTTFSNQ
jgi:hypothetical protein